MKVIFAQGNPEPHYDKTRHNTGFMMLNALAEEYSTPWTLKSKLQAHIAEISIGDTKVLLVKPTTFYNDSGLSARSVVDFYKLDLSRDLLVLHDDLALPLGTIRIRAKGSDAGNNGIKSLNSHLGPDYTRMRIGIWNEKRDVMDDADFVLSKFTSPEAKKLRDDIIPYAIKLIDQFASDKLATTSHKILDK